MRINNCHLIVSLVAKGGVTDVVISPGSRNAPLIAAFDANANISTHIVNDERSAAFVALGIAQISNRCVALLCTSGTALLNYAPALAEARVRHIPLIVITADRPKEIIGRNEPQTIYQSSVYEDNVKGNFNIDLRDSQQFISLNISEALGICLSYPYGPVHINIGIDDPTVDSQSHIPCDLDVNNVEYIVPPSVLDKCVASRFSELLSPPVKVMVIAGALSPSQQLNRAIGKLSSFGNYVVITESVSNINAQGVLHCVDSILSYSANKEITLPAPEIVITCGAPIISGKIKIYITENNVAHWHVGHTRHLPDNFGSLTRYIDVDPHNFFSQIAAATRRNYCHSDFHAVWNDIYLRSQTAAINTIQTTEWNDYVAVSTVLSVVPEKWNIFLSNGMTIRYAQLVHHNHHRCECNRGVSGIDGCTSTAVGCTIAYNGTTLLITGDMSASYDMNALFIPGIDSRFKVVVVNNGGGDIFRHIKATSQYHNVEKYMASNPHIDFIKLGETAGYKTFQASNKEELNTELNKFIKHNNSPAMLIIHTQGADIRNFFKSI